MGLDISKIQNAELKKLAYIADDGNGNLNKDEFLVFKQEAAKKDGVSAEDFNQAMGLYTTNPTSGTTPTQEENKEVKTETVDSKYLSRGMEKDYMDQLKDKATKGYTRAQLVAHLQGENGAMKNSLNTDVIKKYNKALNEVLALMPLPIGIAATEGKAAYQSVADIDKQHDAIVKKLKDAGLKDDLHLNILKELEKAAKNEVKNSSVNNIVIADFYGKIEEAMNKGDFRQETIIEQMKKDLDKAEKDAEKLTDKTEKENALSNIKIKRQALEKIEKETVVANARKYVYDALMATNKTKYDKSFGDEHELQDAAIAYLKANKMWDKYTEKEISRANLVKDSYGEKLIEKTLKANKVKNHEFLTEAQVKDILGKNDKDLFARLVDSGIIVKVEDGENKDKYDMRALSAVIGQLVGEDYTLSRNYKENKMISERLNSKAVLSVLTDKDLKKSEMKELIRLCGYKVEGVNIEKLITSSAIGAAIGSAISTISGTLAAMTNPQHKVYVEGSTVHHQLNLELIGQFDAIPEGMLPEGAEIINNGTGVTIIIDQLLKADDHYLELSKYVGQTALKTALLGAAQGALAGLTADDGEEAITETNFATNDIDTYAKIQEYKNPKYARILTLLAQTFLDEKGNWDADAYRAFLNDAAGDTSVLNKNELVGLLEKRQAEVEGKKLKKNSEETKTEDCDPTKENCTVSVKQEQDQEINNKEKDNLIHNRKGGDTWRGIVEAYYPGLIDKMDGKIWGPNGAIRALQKALCTDENGNFNAEAFKELISQTDIPKQMKMPKSINGIDRVKGDVNGKYFDKDNVAKGDDINKTLDEAGYDQYATVKQIVPGVWVATDGCTNAKASGNSPRAAIEALEKQEKKEYPNKEEVIKGHENK